MAMLLLNSSGIQSAQMRLRNDTNELESLGLSAMTGLSLDRGRGDSIGAGIGGAFGGIKRDTVGGLPETKSPYARQRH